MILFNLTLQLAAQIGSDIKIFKFILTIQMAAQDRVI